MADQQLIVVGSSHKVAPLRLLESLAFTSQEVAAILPDLQQAYALPEVLLLSTCNRTEIYAMSTDVNADVVVLSEWLIQRSQARTQLDPQHIYDFKGDAALDHLMRVICGLDSMMLGETEIAGQVQQALDIAREMNTGRNHLVQTFSAAFRTSKRARNETAINAGTTSVASAAVHLARRVFSDLGRRRVLIVGAGETGSLVARHFTAHAPGALVVANRTRSRAEALAREVGGSVVSFGKWAEVLPTIDIAVCATQSPVPLITKSLVAEAVRPGGARPLLLVDISLPHNIETSVMDVENVYLHDINDLTRIVEKNLSKRAKEIPNVEKIISEEKKNLLSQQATQKVGPFIKDLRRHFEDVRQKEVDRFISKFDEQDRPLAERLTRDLVNKLLHDPMVEIRTLGNQSQANQDRLAWARRLFGLDRISESGDRND
ncbi:MAG: glutamyl-tRNA reductase [Myxococcota bacterium]|nr:glutamyl-tRNA reductase [Myxococcota bacterium]